MATDNVSPILLSRFQFCHVQDRNTGKFTLHEGPNRLQLESHESLVGTWDKIRVNDGQFAVVWNPFDPKTGDIVEGECEIRTGPCVFSLHPGEKLQDDKVKNEFVLTERDALLVKADKDVPHPIEEGATLMAGSEFLIRGPRRFVPRKHLRIVAEREALSLAENEGVFVQNNDTGEVRLVRGPVDLLLAHNEDLWDKRLTDEELEALGLKVQNIGKESRALASAARPRSKDHEAVVVTLEDNEVICLFDGDKTRVEFGPKTVFLEPGERPKVLFISGGVPVRPNVLRLAKLGLGPDFIRDQLTVRTSDNATLVLEVNFRWRFTVDREHPEKLFALKDFVGFTAQTLSSEIREAAARKTFEEFHAKAAEFVKQAIFGDGQKRLFAENGLEIIGVDIESISHEDKEIQKNLTDAIRTNVQIVTHRAQEEAQLASERRLIEGKAKNEAARETLVKLQIANERTIALAQAETAKQATVLQAEAEAQAEKIQIATILERARAEAEAIELRGQAEAKAEEGRIKAIVDNLNSEGGQRFVELERARALKATDKLVIPTDSKIFLGVPASHAKLGDD